MSVPSTPRSGDSWTSERKHLKVLDALDVAETQYYHFSAVLIAGMGFFTDGYDLFCISVVQRLLGRLYYQKENLTLPGSLPIEVCAAVTGTALVGTVTGQIIFGWLGDKLGRKKAYGITLMIMIICSIGSGLSIGSHAKAVIATLCFFRFWLGVGIGGVYPLSATIMSEYANTQTRGAFIAAVFAMQGIGILVGGIVGLFLAWLFNLGFPTPTFRESPLHSTAPQADYLWRIMFMIGALPAALTFYFLMRMPETARYTALVEGNARKAAEDMTKLLKPSELSSISETKVHIGDATVGRRNHLEYGLFSREFLRRHGRHLLGTSTTWFLLDVAFHSQYLSQIQTFFQIGWLPPPSTMNGIEEVYKISRAQCIVAVFPILPGYWVSMFLVDRIGRFVIQLQGFLCMGAFMFGIFIFYPNLDFNEKGHNVTIFVVLYSLTFFFANFGPNTTTFIIPAELFPARFRATCHGISAGSGKVGAIVGTFLFLYASQHYGLSPRGIGLRKTLFLLAGASLIGAAFTFLIPETKLRSLEELTGEKYFSPGDIDSPSNHPNIDFISETQRSLHSKNNFSSKAPKSRDTKRPSTSSRAPESI